MAKYAIPAEVVFTFDDEPVDIQEMLHDNAESEEVVEGLERLLKAVAAPGFTEAEVVFDIGGGISVVRAARRTANPRKYVTNEEAAHLFGVSTDALGDSAKVGQKVTIKTLYPNTPKTYTRTITKVTKRYLTVTDGTRYLRDTLYNDTSGSTWGIPGSEIVKIGGIRVDNPGNPGDDGQQSLPLDYGRTGNPRKAGAVGDFGASTIRALKRRGITIVGTTAIPADAHDRYFSATGYELDDNGTHRIRTYLEVLALADGAPIKSPAERARDAEDADFYARRDAEYQAAIESAYRAREAATLRAVDLLFPKRTGNPHGGGLVSGYGINTFAMDPDDYAPERQSNPRESIATMLGRPRR